MAGTYMCVYDVCNLRTRDLHLSFVQRKRIGHGRVVYCHAVTDLHTSAGSPRLQKQKGTVRLRCESRPLTGLGESSHPPGRIVQHLFFTAYSLGIG